MTEVSSNVLSDIDSDDDDDDDDRGRILGTLVVRFGRLIAPPFVLICNVRSSTHTARTDKAKIEKKQKHTQNSKKCSCSTFKLKSLQFECHIITHETWE